MLNELDVATVHAAAAASGRRAETETAWRRPPPVCEALTASYYDTVYSPEHGSLFLHRDGLRFAECHGALLDKIIRAMVERVVTTDSSPAADAATLPLRLRCLELHSYAAGGALLAPLHRDSGSKLTLSLLLSDSGSFDGGIFVAWREGKPVLHSDLRAGDGVVIDSESLHNVTMITRGVRYALVCELWEGPTNRHDRFT